MRVLLVVHVGETLGHLARAITIARALLNRGCAIDIGAHARAHSVLHSSGLDCTFHPVEWEWSHNGVDPTGISPEIGARILDTAKQVRGLFERVRPDYVLGMPGFASTQVARSFGIPHASLIHGTHLAPTIHFNDPTPGETAVLSLTRQICNGALNTAFRVVAERLSLPMLTYQEFIQSEKLFVTQPGLPITALRNQTVTNFVSATLGEPLPKPAVADRDAVFITFGSGNPCDFMRLLRLARTVFRSVIANTGNLRVPALPDGITTRPFIASSDVAQRVGAVVSHGGIGTVGTFAGHGLAQLIIPTEVDQANMAMHARRSGLAENLGLESFTQRKTLGRRLPDFTDEELIRAFWRLKETQPKRFAADGAETIASSVCGMMM